MISPEEMLEVITRRFGLHPEYHALHAKGVYLSGTFTATPEAAALTKAAHMQGEPVEVIARLSNGGGDPGVPDYAPDVRGLAVGFELPDGSRTDILAQTTPKSPLRTPEQFADLLRNAKPTLAGLPRMALFLARNPKVIRLGKVNQPTLAPPASFAARPYYAVHAFQWIAADGSERWVRYTFVPTEPAPDLSGSEAKAGGRDYLFDEMRERLAAGPLVWTLEVQVAGPGDNPDDGSDHWPDERERINVGTLELTTEVDPEGPVIFDPMRLTDGIEPSGDPILNYRPAAYSASYDRRTATA